MSARTRCLVTTVAALSLTVLSSVAQFPGPNGGTIEPAVLPDHWMTGGPKCTEMPEWQVHEYDPELYILGNQAVRTSKNPSSSCFLVKISTLARYRLLQWEFGSHLAADHA